MKNSNLCVIVVTVCVLCPLLVGYVWPVSTDSETIYKVGDSLDVTPEISGGTVYLYDEFKGLYENNMNVYRDLSNDNPSYSQWMQSVGAVSFTDVVNPVPWGYDDEQPQIFTPTNGFYSIDVISWISNNTPPHYADAELWSVTFTLGGWDALHIGAQDGTKVTSVIYYNQSNMMYYLNEDATEYISTTARTIYFEGSSAVATDIVFNFAYTANQPGYYDLSMGFITPRYPHSSYDPDAFGIPRWFNGYTNQAIDILVSAPNATNNDPDDFLIGSADFGAYVHIKWTSNFITFNVKDNASDAINGTHSILASNDYPFILISMDARSDIITLTGIKGMDYFTDDYQNAGVTKRIFTSFELNYFTYLEMYETVQKIVVDWTRYFIPRTVSNTVSVTGISNVEFSPIEYTSDNYQIQLRNVTWWPVGNGINIYAGGSNHYGTVDDEGNITFTSFNGDTVTASVNNMILTKIGSTMYLNGVPIVNGISILSDIEFIGGWLATAVFSYLEPENKDTYNWIVGGFGLDVSGFCVVGLAASVGSSLAASFYGRKSGAKVGLVMLTAAICGAVYLIILMGGL